MTFRTRTRNSDVREGNGDLKRKKNKIKKKKGRGCEVRAWGEVVGCGVRAWGKGVVEVQEKERIDF